MEEHIIKELDILVATNDELFFSSLDFDINANRIVCCQQPNESIETLRNEDKYLKKISTNTKGASINRNIGLLLSESDFCLLADDDVTYDSNVTKIVNEEFDKTGADVLIFSYDIDSINKKKYYDINLLNYTSFGSVRIAFKRNVIQKNEIFFSTLFGPGAKFSCGEDTIFLHDCLVHGLKIVKTPAVIAELTNERESTWFEGYNEKFFHDKGALFFRIHKYTFWFFAAFFSLKMRKSTEMSFFEILKTMRSGKKTYKKFG